MAFSLNHKTLIVGCLASLFLLGGRAAPVRAEMLWNAYIPPELAYADQLRQRVTIPKTTNINESSLNQLKVLPGFTEEIALKVMRNRPFEGIQDFYRKMPGLDKKRIDRLIEQVQPKLRFK